MRVTRSMSKQNGEGKGPTNSAPGPTTSSMRSRRNTALRSAVSECDGNAAQPSSAASSSSPGAPPNGENNVTTADDHVHTHTVTHTTGAEDPQVANSKISVPAAALSVPLAAEAAHAPAAPTFSGFSDFSEITTVRKPDLPPPPTIKWKPTEAPLDPHTKQALTFANTQQRFAVVNLIDRQRPTPSEAPASAFTLSKGATHDMYASGSPVEVPEVLEGNAGKPRPFKVYDNGIHETSPRTGSSGCSSVASCAVSTANSRVRAGYGGPGGNDASPKHQVAYPNPQVLLGYLTDMERYTQLFRLELEKVSQIGGFARHSHYANRSRGDTVMPAAYAGNGATSTLIPRGADSLHPGGPTSDWNPMVSVTEVGHGVKACAVDGPMEAWLDPASAKAQQAIRHAHLQHTQGAGPSVPAPPPVGVVPRLPKDVSQDLGRLKGKTPMSEAAYARWLADRRGATEKEVPGEDLDSPTRQYLARTAADQERQKRTGPAAAGSGGYYPRRLLTAAEAREATCAAIVQGDTDTLASSDNPVDSGFGFPYGMTQALGAGLGEANKGRQSAARPHGAAHSALESGENPVASVSHMAQSVRGPAPDVSEETSAQRQADAVLQGLCAVSPASRTAPPTTGSRFVHEGTTRSPSGSPSPAPHEDEQTHEHHRRSTGSTDNGFCSDDAAQPSTSNGSSSSAGGATGSSGEAGPAGPDTTASSMDAGGMETSTCAKMNTGQNNVATVYLGQAVREYFFGSQKKVTIQHNGQDVNSGKASGGGDRLSIAFARQLAGVPDSCFVRIFKQNGESVLQVMDDGGQRWPQQAAHLCAMVIRDKKVLLTQGATQMEAGLRRLSPGQTPFAVEENGRLQWSAEELSMDCHGPGQVMQFKGVSDETMNALGAESRTSDGSQKTRFHIVMRVERFDNKRNGIVLSRVPQ